MHEINIPLEKAIQTTPKQGSQGSHCSTAEPFALQVTDDSMEPEFAMGCIIIIDPSAHAHDGAWVLAHDNQQQPIFRRLRIQDQQYCLEALNPAYAHINIADIKQVQGVITQRAGKRRSYHKWYTH